VLLLIPDREIPASRWLQIAGTAFQLPTSNFQFPISNYQTSTSSFESHPNASTSLTRPRVGVREKPSICNELQSCLKEDKMKTKSTFRIPFAILLVAMTAVMSAPALQAAPALQSSSVRCVDSKLTVNLQRYTLFANKTYNVSANDKLVGKTAVDANGNANFTTDISPANSVTVKMVSEDGRNTINLAPVKCVKSKPMGAVYYRSDSETYPDGSITIVSFWHFFPDGIAVFGAIGFKDATVEAAWEKLGVYLVPGGTGEVYTYSTEGNKVTLFKKDPKTGQPVTDTGEFQDDTFVKEYKGKYGGGGTYKFWRGTKPSFGPAGSQVPLKHGSGATVGNNPGTSTAGDPVTTSIGEYYFDTTLLDLGGPLSFQFTLYYAASMNKSSGFFNDPFGGDEFSHSFHIGLKRWTDTQAVVFFGNGYMVEFRRAATNTPWQAYNEQTIHQLQESDKRYYLLDPIAELLYTFDKAKIGNDQVGVFVRVEDRNGNALTFTNDANGRVTRVNDSLGRALTFAYANPTDKWTWPHLVQVTDAFDRAIKFGYKTTSEPILTTHLTSVTDASGAATTFTYTGTVTNTVVASVTYPRGNTPYTQKYEQSPNGLWRVTSQTDALGNTSN
jgi:YD repeat-containing protein